MQLDQQRLASQLRLVGLFLAITGCFLVYSLIQERLMTLGFGPEKERFKHSLFIILVNRLVTCAVAAAALGLLGKSLQPAAPYVLFAVPSVANVISSASQYEALKYVSFPLQALAKCAKTVPVMGWGLLLGGRKYDVIDYVCAVTVTFGCSLFVLTGSIAAPQLQYSVAALAEGVDTRWMLYGLALLAAFLVFDGLTSTAQDKLFAQCEMHSCNQLLWVSVWSTGLSLGFLILTGQLLPSLQFVARHPICMGYIMLLSLVSTAVQLFIFYTIQQYGALHFALIMTLRQFLSIVMSCLVFRHDLSPTQWIGTSLVIGGLVARGMHRGGLDRTSAKQTPSGNAFKAGRTASQTIHQLLPLTLPIISQPSSQDQQAAADAASSAAAKKDGGKIAVDVQAGSTTGSQTDGASGGGGGSGMLRSPVSSGNAMFSATRRKALEMA